MYEDFRTNLAKWGAPAALPLLADFAGDADLLDGAVGDPGGDGGVVER